MPKNEETKSVLFPGRGNKLSSDATETRAITIVADDSEDLGQVTKNSSREIKEETNATLSGKVWSEFGHGNKNQHNFKGDVVKNDGGAQGNIIKGKIDAEHIGNAKGSIYYQTNGSSNDDANDQWISFGNGDENNHNFGGNLVINKNNGKHEGEAKS